MSRRLRFPVLLFLFTLLAAGCSGVGEELPDGAQLLTRSADAMAAVRTARLDLDVQGTVGGFSVQGAAAQVTREGDAAGTVTLDQGGQVTELEFVFTGGTLYLQGPTGGFRELPAALASSVYDPTVILNPQNGVPVLLRRGTGAVTEAREEVGGVGAYRVRATFPGAVLSGLVPGLEQDTSGLVWIGANESRLVQARFPLPNGTATVRLSDFNAPADITAP
ncbi:MAG TPA: LppX_LprAFG lipoprotein [Pseudonocardiaceae bacterium]|jgi:lipoprotein LprG|nr:LppX_LprAFG lipoprotein [Pseudonocardiaceae bacterium]